MARTKQKSGLSLLSEQQRFENRRLAGAFVEMTAALPSRPEPRHIFDNVASPGRALYKGHEAVFAAKVAMRAGIATGKRDIIETTAQNVERFFRALIDAALADYLAIATGELSLDAAREKAHKEGGEALHAILISTARHEHGSELTLREIDEAIAALCELRAKEAAPAQPINRRAALALS